jgi:hypothetical protein
MRSVFSGERERTYGASEALGEMPTEDETELIGLTDALLPLADASNGGAEPRRAGAESGGDFPHQLHDLQKQRGELSAHLTEGRPSGRQPTSRPLQGEQQGGRVLRAGGRYSHERTTHGRGVDDSAEERRPVRLPSTTPELASDTHETQPGDHAESDTDLLDRVIDAAIVIVIVIVILIPLACAAWWGGCTSSSLPRRLYVYLLQLRSPHLREHSKGRMVKVKHHMV